MLASDTQVPAKVLSTSVVIPAFNGGRFIAEALTSVYTQKQLPDEIVVVDDASTDDTVAIVEAHTAQAPVPARIIRLAENSGGPARPLNVGLSECRGTLVVLLEQDDRLTPDKIAEHQRYFAHDPTAAFVFGQGRKMDAAGRLAPDRSAWLPSHMAVDVEPVGDNLFRLLPERSLAVLTREYFMGGAGGTTVSKRAWQDLGGFDEQLTVAWDYDFALRAALAGRAIGFTPRVVFHRRWHGGNLEASDGGLTLVADRVRLFGRLIGNRSLQPGALAEVRRAHLRSLLEACYCYRKAARWSLAAACAGRAARHYGPRWRILREAAKLAAQPIWNAACAWCLPGRADFVPFGPHPPRADGERDGELHESRQKNTSRPHPACLDGE